RFAGKPAVRATARLLAPLQAAAHPAVAFVTFTAFLWLVHFSGVYELALENPPIHLAEHLAFAAAGLLFWLPILSPAPLKPLNFPARLLYCVVLLPQSALVAMALGAAQQPMYAHYAALLGGAALADQRNGAAVMWIGGGLVGFCAFLGTLAAWAKRETRMESA
ncbi:MAG TPA: cytochrome c oxidase assembly protein, partial [Candidatus Tumulicola sp.]|nr:cytochrome c oxidase assembly protein [Candidatus Tumulicola sp.]